jgi:hypothetical protein
MRHSAFPVIVLIVLFSLRPASAQAPPADGKIDARAIILQAKTSQDWLTKVKSFRVRFEDGLELAYDDKRLYQSSDVAGVRWQSWDGSTFIQNLCDGYYEITNSPERIQQAFMTNLIFGRNGQRYWWMQDRRITVSDFVGAADTYEYVGRATFEEVECYSLRSARSMQTAYVGVKDHLLYGVARETGGVAYTFSDYREAAPGRFYPFKQRIGAIEHRVAEMAIGLPLPDALFQQPMKDGANVHEVRADGSTVDYIYRVDRPAAEHAEIIADAARRKKYGPPPLPPGPVRLSSPAEQTPVNPLAVNPAADFPANARWLNGQPVKLADLRGKVVLIVFWASWYDFPEGIWGTATHPPDLKELAGMEQDAVVVGVHVPTADTAKVERAIKAHDFSFPVCIDVAMDQPDTGWGQMADAYRVDQLSTTYVINAQGKVAALGTWGEAVRRTGELLDKPLVPQTQAADGRAR